MRRSGIVGLMAVSAFLAPIVTAAPAQAAACIPIFRQCSTSPTLPPPSPPVTSPPVTSPPVTVPPGPAPVPPAPVSIDPNQAAEQFFDSANAARAGSGLPPLVWRADVAGMAVAHSAEMAQGGSIWHGTFVSSGNLKALNASSLGENVGMGQGVGQVHDAFMNSQHHRENILDVGFNQVGIGVIVVDGGLFVTEDFLQAKGGPASARPTPVAHPVVKKAPAAKAPSNKVAAGPKKVASPPPASPPATTAPPSTVPPTTEPAGVVTALEPVAPVAAPAKINPHTTGLSSSSMLLGVFGVVLLLGAAGGHVVIRRRRPTA